MDNESSTLDVILGFLVGMLLGALIRWGFRYVIWMPLAAGFKAEWWLIGKGVPQLCRRTWLLGQHLAGGVANAWKRRQPSKESR